MLIKFLQNLFKKSPPNVIVRKERVEGGFKIEIIADRELSEKERHDICLNELRKELEDNE